MTAAEDAGKPAASGPGDFGLGAMTEFWAQAGRAALDAQQQAGRMLTDAMKAVPGMGEKAAAFALPGFPALPGTTADPGQPGGPAGQAMAELWTAAAGLSGSMAKAMAGGGNSTLDATLRAVADPRTWLAGMGGLDGVAAAAAEGPRLADLWNAERQQARLTQAWLEVRRRALEHNAVLLEAWMQAGQAFTQELAGRTRAEGRVPDARAVQALWIETANRVLLEAQRSDRFLQTQAATIRAGTEMRLAQTVAAEHWAHGLGLPTRTEMDDVHRTLTTLRREVRTLQRQARPAAVQAPAAEAAPAPAVSAPRGRKKNPEGVP